MPIHITRIQSNQKLIVQRRFPAHVAARIPVNANQSLSPVQIVAQTSHETGFEIVSVADMLGLNSGDIADYLKVNIGDTVRMGTVLAERKKMFGRAVHVTSPVEGTVAEVEDGSLFIIRTPDDLNLRSLIRGTVSHVISGKGVAIQVVGSRFQAAWSNGLEGSGKLHTVGQAAGDTLEIEHLDIDLYDSIVAVGHFDNPSLLKTIIDAGGVGLIAGTVSPDAFQAALEWPHPFMLTDGAGTGGIYGPIYDLLMANSGNQAALFSGAYGETSRPEVVMLSNAAAEEVQGNSRRADQSVTLKAGQRVRLLAGANRGVEGIITKVHGWPQTTATGVKTEGVEVEFVNGEAFFVSTANLDIIM